MAEMGANTVRVFTVPPLWLLDLAAEAGLKVLVGIPWSQHVTFLDNPDDPGATSCARCSKRCADCSAIPPILAYLIGNEIPPDMVRWHGPERVRAFLKRLVAAVKDIDPDRPRQLRQFPVDRIPHDRFHRFPLLQRLSASTRTPSAAISRASTTSPSTGRWC